MAPVTFFLLLQLLSIHTEALEELECRQGYRLMNTEDSGELYSPGYPDKNYPNNAACGFALKSSSGKPIKLMFLDFDLESTTRCGGDALVVQHGDSSEGLETWHCGRLIPKPIISTASGEVNLTFQSNFIKTAKGFKIQFETVESETVCESTDQMQCKYDRTCVPSSAKCNGIFDCKDGSDEENCPNPPQLIPNKDHCGLTPIKPDLHQSMLRIINGKVVVPNSWPWQASIGEYRSFPHGHFCGGSLINNYYVLTAGHCLASMTADQMIVRLGAHDLNADSKGEQWRKVKKVIRHEKYSDADMSNDIGLLLLDTAVNYTDTVQPVCIATSSDVFAQVNSTCITTGWGQTRGSGFSRILKQSALQVQSPEVCLDKTVDDLPFQDSKSVVCATEIKGNAGPCHGDSGGPFVCQDPDGKWIKHGLTSYGTWEDGLKAVCGMGSNTVWNRVAYHLDWIEDKIKNS